MPSSFPFGEEAGASAAVAGRPTDACVTLFGLTPALQHFAFGLGMRPVVRGGIVVLSGHSPLSKRRNVKPIGRVTLKTPSPAALARIAISLRWLGDKAPCGRRASGAVPFQAHPSGRVCAGCAAARRRVLLC